ncbi:MAG TPA: glycosyltransferase family 4 protein [Candidatus Baltobacteraceae bacterium]
MTLAIVSSRYPYSGAESFLAAETRGLQKHFARVIVIPARHGMFSIETFAAALGVLRARPLHVARVFTSLLFAPSSLRIKLKNVLLFPRGLCVAAIVRRENVEHLHAYWLSAPATVALIASRLTGVGWSASAHAWDIYERNLTAEKLASAAFVRTISKQGLEHLAVIAGERFRDKLRCVRLGVDIPRQTAAPAHAEIALVCAANLVPKKGHSTLLRALKLVDDAGIAFRCDIVGKGPLQPRLRRQIEALNLRNKALLLGYRAHGRLLAGLRRGDYDVAILASRQDGCRMEGIPVALIEAMAAGLSCIGTSSGAVGELLDETCGVVVRVHDERALADAVVRLATNARLRHALGASARARVTAEFNAALTTAELAALIRAACEHPLEVSA